MPWVIGIDEAGYGPNLGPLLQAAVTVRLPAHDLAGWATLRPSIRRADEDDDGRLVVDDSKRIYCRGEGMTRLERGVQPFPKTPADILGRHGLPDSRRDLESEYWFADEPFDGDEPCLPFADLGPRVV